MRLSNNKTIMWPKNDTAKLMQQKTTRPGMGPVTSHDDVNNDAVECGAAKVDIV